MIHIGSPDYYNEIKSKLDGYDFIIFEGVKSSKVRLLTASYRYLTRRKKLGLITQKEGLSLRNYKSKLIHGDVDSIEFNNWEMIPKYQRALFFNIFATLWFLFKTNGNERKYFKEFRNRRFTIQA